MVSDGQRKKRSESTSVLELSECLVVLSSIHMHSHGDLTQTPTLNTVCVITSVSLDWASWTFRFIHASGTCYLTSELKRLIGLNLCSPRPASNPSSAFPITPSSKFILPDAQTKKKKHFVFLSYSHLHCQQTLTLKIHPTSDHLWPLLQSHWFRPVIISHLHYSRKPPHGLPVFITLVLSILVSKPHNSNSSACESDCDAPLLKDA